MQASQRLAVIVCLRNIQVRILIIKLEILSSGFDISRSGILVKKGNKIKVYALPDLKEVKFKKL
jgi:hypothetical protein